MAATRILRSFGARLCTSPGINATRDAIQGAVCRPSAATSCSTQQPGGGGVQLVSQPPLNAKEEEEEGQQTEPRRFMAGC